MFEIMLLNNSIHTQCFHHSLETKYRDVMHFSINPNKLSDAYFFGDTYQCYGIVDLVKWKPIKCLNVSLYCAVKWPQAPKRH